MLTPLSNSKDSKIESPNSPEITLRMSLMLTSLTLTILLFSILGNQIFRSLKSDQKSIVNFIFEELEKLKLESEDPFFRYNWIELQEGDDFARFRITPEFRISTSLLSSISPILRKNVIDVTEANRLIERMNFQVLIKRCYVNRLPVNSFDFLEFPDFFEEGDYAFIEYTLEEELINEEIFIKNLYIKIFLNSEMKKYFEDGFIQIDLIKDGSISTSLNSRSFNLLPETIRSEIVMYMKLQRFNFQVEI